MTGNTTQDLHYYVMVKTIAVYIHKVMCTHTVGGPLLYMIMCVPLGLARTDEWSYGSDDV